MMRRVCLQVAWLALLLSLASSALSARRVTSRQFIGELEERSTDPDDPVEYFWDRHLWEVRCESPTLLVIKSYRIGIAIIDDDHQPGLESIESYTSEIQTTKCSIGANSVLRELIAFGTRIREFREIPPLPGPQKDNLAAAAQSSDSKDEPLSFYELDRRLEQLTIRSFPDFEPIDAIVFRRFPFGMAFSPDQNFLYVTLDEESDPGRTPAPHGVAIIDTNTNTLVDTIPITGIEGLHQPAVSPDGRTLYVGATLPPLGLTGELIEVDLTAKVVASRMPWTPPPPESRLKGVVISPDGSLVFAVATRFLAIYDTASRTLAAAVRVSVWDQEIPPIVNLTGSEVYLYREARNPADQTQSGFVVVVDTQTATIAKEWPLPAGFRASTLALSPDGLILAVYDEDHGKIVPIDVSTGQVGVVTENPTFGLGTIAFTVNR